MSEDKKPLILTAKAILPSGHEVPYFPEEHYWETIHSRVPEVISALRYQKNVGMIKSWSVTVEGIE